MLPARASRLRSHSDFIDSSSPEFIAIRGKMVSNVNLGDVLASAVHP